jgi:hypothetical protein
MQQMEQRLTGKFMKRAAIIDTLRGLDRINGVQKRKGLCKHPISTTACGCRDVNCGAFHVIELDRVIPDADECRTI